MFCVGGMPLTLILVLLHQWLFPWENSRNCEGGKKEANAYKHTVFPTEKCWFLNSCKKILKILADAIKLSSLLNQDLFIWLFKNLCKKIKLEKKEYVLMHREIQYLNNNNNKSSQKEIVDKMDR